MIDNIRKLIAVYINQNGDFESWEQIRVLYSVYVYVTFLVIALKSRVGKIDNIKVRAVSFGIESRENIEWIFDYPDSEKFAEEVACLLEDPKKMDINVLYQEFLAVDFIVCNNYVSFSGGKNNRDILGSYYTEEAFAYEISKKAIEEYISNCSEKPCKISIADFSCGGGAFLIAAKRICEEKKIQVKLLGVDVDPIATLITKTRLVNEEIDSANMQIYLGNPLLKSCDKHKSNEAFVMAMKGRYYNPCLGISVDENYDVVIGNPPWEKIRFEEKKFLAHYVQSDLIASKKNRCNLVAGVSNINRKYYYSVAADYENAKYEIRKSDELIDTSKGELNTYALFTEYALKHTSDRGIVGLIVKSSLFKMPVYCEFMRHNIVSKKLFEVYMFVNRKKIFNIDSREEFSVVFYKNQNKENLRIAVGLEEYKYFGEWEKIEISREILELLNPETSMLPNIKNSEELKFLCEIYSRNLIFGEKYKDCRFGRLVHLTNHSQYILHQKKDGFLPVYEGKFIELYTGKYATFKNMSDNDKYKSKASARAIGNISGNEYPEARFFINSKIWNNLAKSFDDGFIIAWRSLTSATNRRTMLATILPLVPTCQSIQLLQMKKNEDMIQILALFNSIVFDYIVRLKMAGLDLTQTIVKQIPVPCDECYERNIVFQEIEDSIKNHITSRVRYLYKDDIRMGDLFDNNHNYKITNKSKKQVIAELDCLVGYLYGLTKEEIKKIAKLFNKYYTNEEVEQWF